MIDKLTESSNYIHYNLDMKIISEIADLKQIPEMHDRIVTATAKLNKATLITKDKDITESKIIETIWSFIKRKCRGLTSSLKLLYHRWHLAQ